MQFIVQGYPAYAYTGARAFDPKLPAVVFVHGAAFDHSVWQWQSRYFAHHARSVLAVDLPGHGRSPGAVRESIEDWAAWLLALADAAGLEEPAIVGHSMGALAALAAAIAQPKRFSRIALAGVAVPMPVSDAFLEAARDAPEVGLEMEAVWGHARGTPLSASAIPGASLLDASRALNRRSKPGVLHSDLRACNAYRAPMEKVRALDLPTLVVAGTRDQMTPLRAGKALASEIPGAKLATLDAGHAMMVERPREFLGVLREFLL